MAHQRNSAPDSSASAILDLLRDRPRTAPALAETLSISGTAVRKQLTQLRLEGLIQEAGLHRGRGRPATTYGLTEAGEATFRGDRGMVLDSVFAAIHSGTEVEEGHGLLRDAGARLARRMLADPQRAEPEPDADPLETALALLEELGGREATRQAEAGTQIIGFVCPLSEYARRYPGACHFVAGFAEEVLGAPVEDRCPRTGEPMCVLAVSERGSATSRRGSTG